MDEIIKDSRFSHIVKDPRFKKIPKKQVKVKIDKRFQSMFNDKKFQIKFNVDKRGRSAKLKDSEDLKRYYDLSDSESDNENSSESEDENKRDNEENKEDVSGTETKEESSEKQENNVIKVPEEDRKKLTSEVKKKLKNLDIDYARGEGAIFSDSSSEEESSDESEMFELEHEWGELDKDAERTEESTKRIAVCNMNWDRIQAHDLMVLFNSFLPPGGLIYSVTIYPSEYGLARMKEEDENGPQELTEDVNEGEESELNQIQMEKLRKYQLNRLKYFYAVVVCDSIETADVVYKECDGLEYESSSNRLDLRFIPDDTVFDQEPKETCTQMPDLGQYKPRLFETSALTKAKVDLTWDETDPNRKDIVKSIHSGNVDENKLKKYLACSSSEESEEENKNIDGCDSKSDTRSHMGNIEKYKALLAEIENKEKTTKKNEVNLEVSWNLKLENKANEIVKEASKGKDGKTPFQQYLEKRKEKKKKKREERKVQMQEDNPGSNDSAFSDDDIPSDIDLNDPYFKEELENTKNKKSKKKKPKKEEEIENETTKLQKAELELLMLDNQEESKHFSLKKIEENEKAKEYKKRKKRKNDDADTFNDDFKIDVNDERFSALFTSHHFNIDPADPQFKATKATKDLIEEKFRRREREDTVMPNKTVAKGEPRRKKLKAAELSVLVKNIKKNTFEVKKKSVH